MQRSKVQQQNKAEKTEAWKDKKGMWKHGKTFQCGKPLTYNIFTQSEYELQTIFNFASGKASGERVISIGILRWD